MSATTTPARPVSIRRRLLLLVVALLVLIVVIGFIQSRRSSDNNRLDKLLADLDEREPGWRLDELEDSRDAIPEMENSARLVSSLAARVPGNWPPYEQIGPEDGTPGNERLPNIRRERLRTELAHVAHLRADARRLITMPRGRHQFQLDMTNPFMIILEEQQRTRRVSALLQFDAIDLAHDGEVTAAIRSAHAGVNASRALGDEPFLISQLIRYACFQQAGDAVERSLALGESKEKELADLQAILIEDEKHNGYLAGTRGERASQHAALKGLASGKVPLQSLLVGRMPGDMSVRQRIVPWTVRSMASDEHASILKLADRAVDIARMPTHEQQAAENVLQSDIRKSGRLANVVLHFSWNSGLSHRRKLAYNRCLIALVAVERYRMKHGKWPVSLAALQPELLGEIPLDPFDGKPLRYARLVDGAIVYSVGQDRHDDGGLIERTGPVRGTDVGYRLWNADKRNQPAKVK